LEKAAFQECTPGLASFCHHQFKPPWQKQVSAKAFTKTLSAAV